MVKLKIKPRKTKPNKKGHKEQYLEKEATNQRRKERKNYVKCDQKLFTTVGNKFSDNLSERGTRERKQKFLFLF